jgi:hypothetical protein
MQLVPTSPFFLTGTGILLLLQQWANRTFNGRLGSNWLEISPAGTRRLVRFDVAYLTHLR